MKYTLSKPAQMEWLISSSAKKLLYREIFKNTQATTTTAKKKEMRCQFSHPVRTVLQPIHGVFDTHKTKRRYV